MKLVELYSLIMSASTLLYGSVPMRGSTSVNVANANADGSLVKGFNLLNRRNEVVGCLIAAERNAWSVRRNDTRFSGEPREC